MLQERMVSFKSVHKTQVHYHFLIHVGKRNLYHDSRKTKWVLQGTEICRMLRCNVDETSCLLFLGFINHQNKQ